MQHRKTTQMILAAMFVAVTAVAAQLNVPLGFTPVHFSLVFVAVFLTGAMLEPRAAFFAQLAYLLLGAAGAPVFSFFTGGLAKLAGPTGGYLLAYPFMALLVSLLAAKWGRSVPKSFAAMTAAMLLGYALGTAQLMLLTGCGLWEGLTLAVLPFAPFDLAKAAISAVLAAALHRALRHARLLATLA